METQNSPPTRLMALERPEATKEDIVILKQGITSEFWNVIKKFVEYDIVLMTSQLTGDDDKDYTDEERRQIREKRLLNKRLLEYPQQLINDAEPNPTEPSDSHDPYD